MSEALRGTRLGATSYETDARVELAPRQAVFYDCPNGHVIAMPFSEEVTPEEMPYTWECRCGADAILRDGVAPEAKAQRHVRTHWDMLLERRSMEELEEVFRERLALLREERGEAPAPTAKRRKSA